MLNTNLVNDIKKMTKDEISNEIIKHGNYPIDYKSKLMRKKKEELIILLEVKLKCLNNSNKKEKNEMIYLNDTEKIIFERSLREDLKQLRPDQVKMINLMEKNSKFTFKYPTACGKGFIMINDIKRRIIKTDENILVVVSHKLDLNAQHLDDIFDKMLLLTGKIGYVFVGSCEYEIPYLNPEHKSNKFFEEKLEEKKLKYSDIITPSTTNEKEIKDIVDYHLSNNRKVIMISTYHSLHNLKSLELDTVYYDEAHKLANDKSESQTKFEENFKKITSKNRFFFTATPKQEKGFENSFNFLMNNKEVFGESDGLTYNQAVEINAITKPIIQLSYPVNYDDDKDFSSLRNKAKFAIESYEYHRKYQKSISLLPDEIDGKVLIKCDGLGEVWGVTKLLVEQTNYNIAAVGSTTAEEKGVFGLCNKQCYLRYNGVELKTDNRKDFIKNIRNIKLNENLMVLHDDIFTEGINIISITSTMFLSDSLPPETSIIQNLGRTTRLLVYDRDLLNTGKITKLENNKCLKPSCSVIIPYWNNNTNNNSENIERTIIDLVLNNDFFIEEVSLGTNRSKGSKNDELDNLVLEVKESKSKNKLDGIENIIKIIEDEKKSKKILAANTYDTWLDATGLSEKNEEEDKFY